MCLLTEFPRRGQIYWAEFSPTMGSEQSGRRPAVVVSSDASNRGASVVVVAPITTNTKSRFPQNVFLPRDRPLREESMVLCGQIRTVTRKRLYSYMVDLSSGQLREVERALALVLALPSAPPRVTTSFERP